MPPTIGAAIRFIRSAPVPVDHMIGKRPSIAAQTVIAFGRTRFTAPWTIQRRYRKLPAGSYVHDFACRIVRTAADAKAAE